MKNWTIYEHITPSGKRYIGITSKENAKKRWRDGKGYKNTLFGKAIEKYKWENIQHNILFNDLTEKEAKWLENYLICYYRTYVGFKDDCKGYNCTLGGDGQVGWEPTKETREKIGKSGKGRPSPRKGKHHSTEAKKKISESRKGIHLTEETRHKQSESRKGLPCPTKGMHRVYHEDGTFHFER